MKNHIPDELQEKLNLKKNKVLIGDAIEDKKMVPEEQWDETILVGFLNENIKNNLENNINCQIFCHNQYMVINTIKIKIRFSNEST